MLASACVRGASLEQGGCYRVTEERLYQALSSYAPPVPDAGGRPTAASLGHLSPSFLPAPGRGVVGLRRT
jgi:hypothetical protein